MSASAIFGVIYGLILSEGVMFGLLNGLLNGLFISALEGFWVRRRRGRRLRRLPLVQYLAVLTLIWSLIVLFNMTITRHWLGMDHSLGLSWMMEAGFWRHFLFCFFMAFTFNLLLRVVSFLGNRSLIDILLGRYQEPVEETLAFLFLDVAGSTRLTEQLGDAQTQRLIGQLFFELAETVERYGGEVHRYIGDEMVITWNLQGRKQQPDILGCLGAIFRHVDQFPHNQTHKEAQIKLRAGLHAGDVLISEVGDQKRELVYFGNTINIAAGLQQHCKQANTHALISNCLFQRLHLPAGISADHLGEICLKGKLEPIAAVALDLQGAALR